MTLGRVGIQGVLIVALIAVVGQGGYCQKVSITAPEDGARVRGKVLVQGTKASADGWISFRVGQGDTEGEYIHAVTSPFEFKWDTQVRDEDGNKLYPDGQYRLVAVAHDAAGHPQGEASITVTVGNDIKPSEVGGKVNLRSLYLRGQQVLYALEGETNVILGKEAADYIKDLNEMSKGGMGGGMMGAPGGPMPMGGIGGVGGPAAGMPRLGGMVGGPAGAAAGLGGMGQMEVKPLPTELQVIAKGKWTEECLSPTATGRAVIDKIFEDGWYAVVAKDAPGPRRLKGAGEMHRVKVFPTAVVEPMHDDSPRFAYGELYIELPDRDLRVGDTWNGQMTYCAYPEQEEPIKTQATHKLDGFEYRGAYRCARIVSTFAKDEEEGDWQLAGIPVTGQMQAGGGMGGMGAPGGPGMGALGGPGPGMGGPGFGGPGGPGMWPPATSGGMPGAGFGTEPPKFESKLEGTRVSYFALDAGRFVAMQDTLKREVELMPQALTGLLAAVLQIAAPTAMGGGGQMGPGSAMPGFAGPGPAGPGMGGMPGAGMPAPGGPMMGPGGPGMPGPAGPGGMMPGPGMPGPGMPGPGMPGAAMPGRPGMPGGPGMVGRPPGMPGGMMPGGMMPGQPGMPGGPGMMPRGPGGMMGAPGGMGMPGGMAGGMGMAQVPAEPVKFSVKTKLSIEEKSSSGGPTKVARW